MKALLQVRSDRCRFHPYGLHGGRPGTPSQSWLVRDGVAQELPSKVTMTMRRGDVFQHVQPGTGGYGDPFERDPERVLDDVRNGKVSLEAARRDYGVAIDPVNWTVDAAEKARLRARRREGEPATPTQATGSAP